MSDNREWVEVVPLNDPQLAKSLFRAWSEQNGAWFGQLKDEDIRIDTVWMQDRTTKVRYKVRSLPKV